MITESQQDLTQNRSLYHRVFDTLDTTAMQNPKGNLNVFPLNFHHLLVLWYLQVHGVQGLGKAVTKSAFWATFYLDLPNPYCG